MFVKLILGLLIRVEISAGCRRRGDLRVYQGEIDSKHEFPFAVSLERVNVYSRWCTGSVIAPNWVITAAHCIDAFKPRDIVIKYGDFTRPPNKTKLYKKVIKIFVHPNYRLSQGLNDIGLILTERVPDMEQAKLLALDHKTLFGLRVKYAGFGATMESVFESYKKKTEPFHPVHVGEGVVVPCQYEDFAKVTINDYTTALKYSGLCIASKCSKSRQAARPGHSGGPLLYDGRLIGVCSSLSLTSISRYTAISPYLQWIQSTMQSELKSKRY